MTAKEISRRLSDIYIAKNKDYGNSAHRTYIEFGEVALVVRISDKLSRLTQLTLNKEANVRDESVIDTIGDAITYLCMLCAEMLAAATTDENASESERIADNRSFDLTLQKLELLAYTDESIGHRDDPSKYRTRLMVIWTTIITPADRMAYYFNLAQLLMNEYRKRVSNDNTDTKA